MANQGRGGKSAKASEKAAGAAGIPSPWFAFVMLLDWVSKRFGAPAAVFLAIAASVKVFANETTQDQVVREIFFHETTKRPFVQGFFVVLFVLIVIDVRLIERYFSGERAELRRVAKEKSRLQVQVLGNVTTSAEAEQ